MNPGISPHLNLIDRQAAQIEIESIFMLEILDSGETGANKLLDGKKLLSIKLELTDGVTVTIKKNPEERVTINKEEA